MNMYEICLLHARSDRALRSKIASLLEESQITMMEWLLLGVVAEGPGKGSTMSEIAKSLHVTLPQVTALVNKLLPLKLVKQKSANSDRRSRLVSLTSKGQLVFDENNKIMDAAQQTFFHDASEQDLESYSQILTHLSE
jgi:DNA-binding MarR family transcriptional regulator